jgi:hypothetical protein
MVAMRRVFRGYLVHFGLALAAIGALPAAALATPSPTTVSEEVHLEGGGVTTWKQACPRDGLALSGYVTEVEGGAFARDSVPGDLNHWNFAFTSSAGSGHGHVSVRCLRMKLPKGVRAVQTKVFTRKSVVHPLGGSSAKTRISCRKGYVPVGWGIDRSAAGGDARTLQVSGAIPRTHSWDFRVKNTGTATQTATVYLRCLGERARSQSGRKLTERFKLRRVAELTKTGTGTLSARCPSGYYSLAAGYLLRPTDDILARGAFPVHKRSGRFAFTNPSGASENVRTYLSCLSLKTSFR